MFDAYTKVTSMVLLALVSPCSPTLTVCDIRRVELHELFEMMNNSSDHSIYSGNQKKNSIDVRELE